MISLLAFRHLMVRKLRSLFLLAGFSLGVGVMIVLLSVGQAMLDQSRDVSLVGGGELTVLPQGIDIEAMRTGGVSGMFFGIDRARFLTRQVLGGPRQQSRVQAVSPVIEGKLLYLQHRGRTVAVRAGGEIPSRARSVGSGLGILAGKWQDSRADRVYLSPTPQEFYDELDRFHVPARPDSTWGEWHYFNLVISPNEWWYVTYLVGGELPVGNYGGQLLVTRRRPDGRYERFTAEVPSEGVEFDTARADLTLGESTVRQREGTYNLVGEATGPTGVLKFRVTLNPAPHRYFPPLELQEDPFVSGYVVPALAATASGEICLAGVCRKFDRASAYHDHNWGVWRDVTWEWGTGQGSRYNVLYGGVYGASGTAPFFLTVIDSVGVKQVLRFGRIRYQGARPAAGETRATAPQRFSLLGTHDADTVRLDVKVADALATRVAAGDFRRVFIQMRGEFGLTGRVAGEVVADSGLGFFETYVPGPEAASR